MFVSSPDSDGVCLSCGSIEEFIIGHTLAKGSFGFVHCGKLRDINCNNEFNKLALKVCSKSKLKKIKLCEFNIFGRLVRFNGLDKFYRECNILKSLMHANIVRFVQAFMDDEEDAVVLVTELARHGPFLTYNERTERYAFNVQAGCTHRTGLVGSAILRYFRDIAQAVSYLHARNICHRDIKPANLLLSDHDTILLCDFGSAEHYSPDSHNPGGMVSNTVGSPAFWAPESIFPEKYESDVGLEFCDENENDDDGNGDGDNKCNEENVISKKDDAAGECYGDEAGESNCTGKICRFSAYGLDMWSLGVVLFIMFYKRHPFFEERISELSLYERIDTLDPFHCERSADLTTRNMCKDDASDTNKCADELEESAGRVVVPSVEECAILEGLLQKEPTLRYSIESLIDILGIKP